jgi:hypothetical protein
METKLGGLVEGDVFDGSRHPRGVSIESDLEVGFGVNHRVLWRFERVAQTQKPKTQHHYHRPCFLHLSLLQTHKAHPQGRSVFDFPLLTTLDRFVMK